MLSIPVYPDPKHPGRFVTKDRLFQNEQSQTKVAEPVATKVLSKPETVVPTISASQQQALIDIKKYKSGERINMQCHTSQAETKEPELVAQPMSFEQEILHTWKNDPGIRQEFVSLSSYQAFKKAEKEGKTKIVCNRIIKGDRNS